MKPTTNERKILDFIRAKGGEAGYADILIDSGLSRESAVFNVAKLRENGFIKRVGGPSRTIYVIGDAE